jgi:hypothetical protein
LDLEVFYFACDDALTFCIPVTQNYRIWLQQDMNHGPSAPGEDSQNLGRPGGGMGMGRAG